MLRHDRALFQIDMGQHHPISGYQLATNRVTKVLFGYFVPTIESHTAFSHRFLRFPPIKPQKAQKAQKAQKRNTGTLVSSYASFFLCLLCFLCLLWLVLASFVARAKDLAQLHARLV